MKYSVSHISTSDLDGGSAVSAKRIHMNLLNNKVESKLFVGNQSIRTQSIFSTTRLKKLRNVDNIVNIFFNKFGFQYLFLPSNLFLDNKIFKSDIVQLYNIHGGYFQISSLKKIAKFSKIVWRLSDYWPMTGHCAYPGNCNKWEKGCSICPDLNLYPSIGLDRTKHLWNKKKEIIQEIDLKIVVPTKKMLSEVQQSSILSKKQITIIPNGVNTKKFKLLDKIKTRKTLKIPNIFSILFISHVAYNNPRKGTNYLYEILKKLENNDDIQKIIVGLESKRWKKIGFKNLITFDYTNSEIMKVKYYNCADCTLLPSVDENFPNVALESMSCGTPIIAFASGGISELVNNKNGILIKEKQSEIFYRSIITLNRNKKMQHSLAKNARKTIELNYSTEKEVNDYLNLHQEILVKDNKS